MKQKEISLEQVVNKLRNIDPILWVRHTERGNRKFSRDSESSYEITSYKAPLNTFEAEVSINGKTGKVLVEIDERYFRPTEVDLLLGDATKAYKTLGWKPKYTIAQLVKEMVASDVKLFSRDKYLLEGGHEIMKFNE